jgi:transposase InsO family protein
MDLYGRYIIDFGFSKFEDTTALALKVLQKHIKNKTPSCYHTDGGHEFKNWEMLHYLELNNVTQSFSRPGKPKDNGCIESFFATLKHELNLRQLIKTKTEQETKDIISK